MTIAEQKQYLRTELRAVLAEEDPQDLQASDALLLERFLSLPAVEKAKTIFLYRGIGREIQTGALLEALWARGKRLALPRSLAGGIMEARLCCDEADLIQGRYGILEPAESAQLLEKADLDLVLVPALACDRLGVRLGQGGGYYDRYLSGCLAPRVALCRDLLLQDRLPAEAFDQKVDVVLTETEQIYMI